ncbi:hypothetical protein J4232_04870 [Candidatus Woesearchaeota archaeon]|nr:hypothetical protein [Candidatus Woesearchaeota archaeon]
MTKLYILDLDGTTGTYLFRERNGKREVDTMFLRPGLKKAIDFLNNNRINSVIATRAAKGYAEQIVKCWKDIGIEWRGKIYSKNDVNFPEQKLFPYKNLAAVYKEQGVTDPERETVMIGDFLGFNRFSTGAFTIEDYLRFDFEQNPEQLWNGDKLIDHPCPVKSKSAQKKFNIPIYVVLPQAYTLNTKTELVTIDMLSVIDFLEQMYLVGNENFYKGFNALKSFKILQRLALDNPINSIDCIDSSLMQQTTQISHQFVESDGLAKSIYGEILGEGMIQKYLVMKALQRELKPLTGIDIIEEIYGKGFGGEENGI